MIIVLLDKLTLGFKFQTMNTSLHIIHNNEALVLADGTSVTQQSNKYKIAPSYFAEFVTLQ
jgi:hypothetical protein